MPDLSRFDIFAPRAEEPFQCASRETVMPKSTRKRCRELPVEVCDMLAEAERQRVVWAKAEAAGLTGAECIRAVLAHIRGETDASDGGDEIDERAAILEVEAGYSRADAERIARLEQADAKR